MKKQQDILKSALYLFVELGFHATPTSRIAKEACVATGTLFHYYKNKEELILSLYRNIMAELALESKFDPENHAPVQQLFQSMCRKMIDWAIRHKQEVYFIRKFKASPYELLLTPEEREQENRPVLILIQKGIRSAVLKQLPEPLLHAYVHNHLYGLMEYLASNDLIPEMQEDLIPGSFDLLWDGIARGNG